MRCSKIGGLMRMANAGEVREDGRARDTIFVYDSGIEPYVDQNDTLCLIVSGK